MQCVAVQVGILRWAILQALLSHELTIWIGMTTEQLKSTLIDVEKLFIFRKNTRDSTVFIVCIEISYIH